MGKPKKLITKDEAIALEDYWLKTRGKAIEGACGYQDCREYWYSLNDLQDYIDYVKKKAKKKGYKTKDLGLRIYLGTYPPTKDKHDGLSTVFLAPTVKKSQPPKSQGKDGSTDGDDDQENIYDIEPLNKGGNGWPPNNYGDGGDGGGD
ncbi:hypothetical protein GWK08_10750 [Leptobacterium flavescens]|uniref:Uncharacterized protein n=1 Tax=Leptobacterium flavescens TaxID=472055 RepID=A0A6P0UKM4_9FLAO|nr:hypothetical protein [Leptobacterium flavescens]NER13921.1 hypothetical protein [Leptobacterium flavescens]